MKKHAEKFRFALVGALNTALDFALLFLFTGSGVHKIPANYLSTGIALLFSFFVNKSFTFRSKSGDARKQFALFLIITLAGLWILQPVIILSVDNLLASTGWSENIILFVAKIVATVATLIWNYLLYSRYVFKKQEK